MSEKYSQPMDDYKRALYMQARSYLEIKENYFVCRALVHALGQEGFDDILDIDEEILELFPEFASLYDGTHWFEKGKCETDDMELDCSWWEFAWAKPRIRALDCLLRDSR